jgi:hypothetical protein
MKNIWLADVLVLVLVLALLSVGLAKAGDVAETNAMPARIRNLMETQGYALKPYFFSTSLQNTNSQRNLPLAKGTQFVPFESPKPKPGWNPWDNSSLRHVGRTGAPVDPFSPPFSHYEYDLTYSFDF